MRQNKGAIPGSHASHEAATHLRPSGVDPERVHYALGLMVEEMGEAMQLFGKALRFGLDTPGVKRLDGSIDMEKTPRSMLAVEIGDIHAAIRYAAMAGVFSMVDANDAENRKFAKLLDPNARDNLGRRLAPAIAMEAATAGETEGLDPKGDSAGLQGIAQHKGG